MGKIPRSGYGSLESYPKQFRNSYGVQFALLLAFYNTVCPTGKRTKEIKCKWLANWVSYRVAPA